MEQLLRSTTAYKMLAHEAAEDRLANTYLLLFPDEHNLRGALKVFAPLFFDGSEGTRARIGRENHPDCLFFPAPGKAPDRDMAEAVVEAAEVRRTAGIVRSARISFFSPVISYRERTDSSLS